jgi:hypothetical protein
MKSTPCRGRRLQAVRDTYDDRFQVAKQTGPSIAVISVTVSRFFFYEEDQ